MLCTAPLIPNMHHVSETYLPNLDLPHCKTPLLVVKTHTHTHAHTHTQHTHSLSENPATALPPSQSKTAPQSPTSPNLEIISSLDCGSERASFHWHSCHTTGLVPHNMNTNPQIWRPTNRPEPPVSFEACSNRFARPLQ